MLLSVLRLFLPQLLNFSWPFCSAAQHFSFFVGFLFLPRLSDEGKSAANKDDEDEDDEDEDDEDEDLELMVECCCWSVVGGGGQCCKIRSKSI